MIPVKYKNIIYAEEKYIMQQCNCLTITAHGLSKTLAESFPHGDSYEGRRAIGRRNCAIQEDRVEPGSVGILEGEDNLSIYPVPSRQNELDIFLPERLSRSKIRSLEIF